MMLKSASRRPLRAAVVHLIRVVVTAALLFAIPAPRGPLSSDSSAAPAIDLTVFAQLGAVAIGPQADANGMWPLLDREGGTVGRVARTLPLARSAIGYRGPTEAAIVFDQALNVLGVELIASADTDEHVEAVKKSEPFIAQFRGWKWGETPPPASIDGVSGATLTSLAMAEGVVTRIGGERPSLVFPNPIELSELAAWVGDSVTLDKQHHQILVHDQQGRRVGRIIRTGRLSDDVIGYQGPTELFVWLSQEDRVVDLRIRQSFDNQPYVGYVRTERSFWKKFKGKTVAELASFDPAAAGIEGVSGATMTSMAIADTLVASAQAMIAAASADVAAAPRWAQSLRWSGSDWVSVAILAVAFGASGLGWFRRPMWRRVWLMTVVLSIGLWTGNLVSMALIAGWSAEGIAWQLAPGLFAIAATAFVVPPLMKSNPYCNHLCPHGAIQQLIKPSPRSMRHLKVNARMARWLTWIPGLTLVAAYLMLITRPVTDLSAWEPFHAYLFRIASWSSIGLAVASLLIAAMVPMAYCRLGCPTGRLLDHVRRSAHSHRITLPDYVSAGLLAVACWLRWG